MRALRHNDDAGSEARRDELLRALHIEEPAGADALLAPTDHPREGAGA